MRNPYQRKAASKQATQTYNAQDIYKQFIETIVSQGHVLHCMKMAGRSVPRLQGNVLLQCGKIKVWQNC